MSGSGSSPDPGREQAYRRERRRIVRRATSLTAGLVAATLGVAVAGGALVALLLSFAGMPFLPTWVVVTLIVLGIPLIGQVVGALRRGRGG